MKRVFKILWKKRWQAKKLARQANLVSDEHDCDVLGREFATVLKPCGEVIESLTTGDIINEESSRRAAVIAARDAAELLLARSVPDLEFHLLLLDADRAAAELDPDCQVVDRLEPLVRELKQETRLSDSCGLVPCGSRCEKQFGMWGRRRS